MSLSPNHSASQPWYRHPWPWLLMLAPGIAVVWGLSTLYIAIKYRDPLVTEHAWQDGQRLEHPVATPPAAPQHRPAAD